MLRHTGLCGQRLKLGVGHAAGDDQNALPMGIVCTQSQGIQLNRHGCQHIRIDSAAVAAHPYVILFVCHGQPVEDARRKRTAADVALIDPTRFYRS